MNYRKLLGKVIERYGNQADCARAIGVSRSYFNQLLNGKKEFSYNNVVKLVDVLELSERETLDIFFPNVVDKSKL